MNFDRLNVETSSGDKLGEIDGFIVDSGSGRPYYVAVDAGGWFKSKLFLLPIGHTSFDSSRRRLIADITRERVNQFPGFDRREFERLPDDDLRRMDEQIVKPTAWVVDMRHYTDEATGDLPEAIPERVRSSHG